MMIRNTTISNLLRCKPKFIYSSILLFSLMAIINPVNGLTQCADIGPNGYCDLDTIINAIDEDDDNDGILDVDEQQVLDCNDLVVPVFGAAQGPNSIGGSDPANPQVGDSFLYNNVYAGVDAIVTVVSSTDIGILAIDVPGATAGFDENFQPQIDHSNDGFTEFRVDFVVTNTTNPAPLQTYVFTTIDNDVNEYVVYANTLTSEILVDTPTNQVSYSGSGIGLGFEIGLASDGTVINGIPLNQPSYHVTGVFSLVDTVSFRLGSELNNGLPSNHSVAFTPCTPQNLWNVPPVLLEDIDTDGDGIVDSLDTDKDGDGCPDALEGAATNIGIDDLNTDGSIDYANTGGLS